MSKTVLDPYRPEDYDQNVMDLEDRGSSLNHFAGWEYLLILPLILIILTALATMFLQAANLIAVAGSEAYFLTAVGASGAVGLSSLFVDLRRRALFKKHIEDQMATYRIETTSSAFEPMKRISNVLRLLPPEKRAEFRPLWDNARDASDFMLEAGYDDGAMERIVERAEALAVHARVHFALTAEMEDVELELKQASTLANARSDYVLEGDEDLEDVRIYTAALGEGQSRFRSLTNGEVS